MNDQAMLGITRRRNAPVWSARGIYTRPGERPDVLPDRQDLAGADTDARQALADALNAEALRAFLQSVTDGKLNPAGCDLVSIEDHGMGAVTIRTPAGRSRFFVTANRAMAYRDLIRAGARRGRCRTGGHGHMPGIRAAQRRNCHRR